MVQCNSVPHMPHKMHMFDNEKSITTKPVRVAGRQGGYVPPKTAAYIWNATPPVLQEGFIPPITYDKSEPCNAIPPDPNRCFKINRSYLINSTSIWYSSRYHTYTYVPAHQLSLIFQQKYSRDTQKTKTWL